MGDTQRYPELEKLLAERGWSDGRQEIHAYMEYRQKTDKNDWTIYCKYPVWKWDFVYRYPTFPSGGVPGKLEFTDCNIPEGTWYPNLRIDLQLPTGLTLEQVADELTKELELDFDSCILDEDWIYLWAIPVQRVADRPKGVIE